MDLILLRSWLALNKYERVFAKFCRSFIFLFLRVLVVGEVLKCLKRGLLVFEERSFYKTYFWKKDFCSPRTPLLALSTLPHNTHTFFWSLFYYLWSILTLTTSWISAMGLLGTCIETHKTLFLLSPCITNPKGKFIWYFVYLDLKCWWLMSHCLLILQKTLFCPFFLM